MRLGPHQDAAVRTAQRVLDPFDACPFPVNGPGSPSRHSFAVSAAVAVITADGVR